MLGHGVSDRLTHFCPLRKRKCYLEKYCRCRLAVNIPMVQNSTHSGEEEQVSEMGIGEWLVVDLVVRLDELL
jgi:hypothetical protein